MWQWMFYIDNTDANANTDNNGYINIYIHHMSIYISI